MPNPVPKAQAAYLHDMLEAARLISRYMRGIGFDDFWANSEKRDAVALRLAVLGEAAHKIDAATEKALPRIPFRALRGLRNRIAHDYGAVDFRIVWAITQKEIRPLARELKAYLAKPADGRSSISSSRRS